MYLQKNRTEGTYPIAYIRCNVDSKKIVDAILSANKEASKLLAFNVDIHLNRPIHSLYPYFSKLLPWHSIFLIPSTHELPYTKEFYVAESEEYYSATAMQCSAENEVVFLIRDISFEHYLLSVQEEITKTQFDVLVFLNENLVMQDIVTSNDKEYLTRTREEIIGYSMREVFGNEFAIPMEELALSARSLKKKTSMIYISPEAYDARRFKVIANSISTKKTISYILSIKDITSDIDLNDSLSDSIRHGIIVHDENGTVYSANRRLFDMTGFDEKDVIGGNITSILSEYKSQSGYETILRNTKEQLYRVSVSSTPISPHCKKDRIVTCITNITEIQTAERLLERKIAFENILFDLTNKIFTSNELTFDPIINHALEVLGSFSGSDRSYIFLFREGEIMDNTHEWCAVNISPEIDNLQQLPKDIFPNLIMELSEGKEIYVHEVNKLNDDWIAEREILLAQSVKSILFQPIIGQNHNYGFIGFDAVRSNMSWNKDERQLLRYFANNVGEVLSRNEYTKQMKEMSEKAELLAHERELMNKELNSFFAKMSHEIRNSINSIIGVNNMLLDTHLDPHQLRLTKIVKSSSDFLLNLVRDVLDYSRIDQSTVELHIVPFSLRTTIEQVISSFNQAATDKGISILYQHDRNIPITVQSDPIKIGQILSNLLSNAIKYSDNGQIIVSTHLVEDFGSEIKISLSVKDTGVGIKPDDITKIFEPYYQVQENKKHHQESTGLGLPIVKWLVTAMKGLIEVESVHHQGSKFIVTLPFGIDTNSKLIHPIDPSWINTKALVMNTNSQSAEEIASILKEYRIEVDVITTISDFNLQRPIIEQNTHPYTLCIIDDSIINDEIYNLLKKCKEEGIHNNHLIFITHDPTTEKSLLNYAQDTLFDGFITTPVDSTKLLDEIHSKMRLVERNEKNKYDDYRVLSSLKILVVEDIAINQEIMLYLLGQVGATCEAVNNGLSAIESIKTKHFDVVLLDMRMPGIDGFETTRRIRELPDIEISRIPIVAMTANVSGSEKERCLIAGMDDYLSKPIKPEELYGTLLQFLPSEIITLPDEKLCSNTSKNSVDHIIEGIDIEKTLVYLHGDMELFIRLLNQFYEGYKDFSALYEETAKDENERLRFVHSVRSICANLGATRLSQLATQLEKMISQQLFEDYEQTEQGFLDEFSLIIDSLKTSPYIKRGIDKVDENSISLSLEEIIKILNTLRKGLISGKAQSIAESMEKLLNASFEGIVQEKVANLQNLTRLYKYHESISQLDEIVQLLSEGC